MEARVTRLEADLANHVKNDEERHVRIEASGNEIKQMIRDLSTEVKNSVQRIHTMREEGREAARLELGVVEKVARGAHQRIDDQKVWILTQALAGVVMAIGMAAWLWDHFGNKAH